jgi:hypothetical protein
MFNETSEFAQNLMKSQSVQEHILVHIHLHIIAYPHKTGTCYR